MGYLTPEIKTFKGLFLQPNSFAIPDGGLEQAHNVIQESEHVIAKCRGYYTYFPAQSAPLNGLIGFTTYDNHLIGIYNNYAGYFTNTGSSPNVTGVLNSIQLDDNATAIAETQTTYARFVQSNGNLYFTTDNGILKLNAYNGLVTLAGAPPAVDLEGQYLLNQAATWLEPNVQVGYRVLFGYKDTNNNVILGSPSSVFTINNPQVLAQATATNATPSVVTVTSANHGLSTGMYMQFFNEQPNDIQDAAILSVTGAGPSVVEVLSNSHGLKSGDTIKFFSPVPNTVTGAIVSCPIVRLSDDTFTFNTASATPPNGNCTNLTQISYLYDIPANDNATGTYQITVTNANQFTYTTPLNSNGIANITYAYAMPVALEFSIPTQITGNLPWYYQLYRTSQQPVGGSLVTDYQLIQQEFLTANELIEDVVFFNDNVPDTIRSTFLYTNQNSGEGELQANSLPPKCRDLTLFQDYLFYGAVTLRANLAFSVIKPANFVATASNPISFIEIQVGTPPAAVTIRRYPLTPYYKSPAITSAVGNKTVYATVAGTTGGGTTGDLLVTFSSGLGFLPHGTSATDAWGIITVEISNIGTQSSTSGALANGKYYLIYQSDTTFLLAKTLNDWLAPVQIAVPYNGETSLYFQTDFYPQFNSTFATWSRTGGILKIAEGNHGLEPGFQVFIDTFNVTGPNPIPDTKIYTVNTVINVNQFTIIESLTPPPDSIGGNVLYNALFNDVFISKESSVAVSVRETAQALVKAINRDPDSLVYAMYTSDPNETPGQILLLAKNYTGNIALRANTLTVGTGFYPNLPDSFSTPDNQIYGVEAYDPNKVAFSKAQIPEAVPFSNTLNVGSRNKPLWRLHALRNALICLKEDGLFRVTGDNASTFSISIIDPTAIIVGENTSAVLDNKVFFLSQLGVVSVTETDVEIISRPINNQIQGIVNQTGIDTYSFGLAYEIERSYYLTSSTPTTTSANTMYVWNTISETWTTQEWTFSNSAYGPDNVMYLLSTDGRILRERKNNNKLDYTKEVYSITVTAVTSSLICVITSSSYAPLSGDGILNGTDLNIIQTVTLISGSSYRVTFYTASNIVSTGTYLLYQAFTSTIELAPYSGGLVGRSKQFAEMQVHFRGSDCTALSLNFSGDYYPSSQTTPISWITQYPSFYSPDLSVSIGTTPGIICRTYIPRNQQRGTFIQPILINRVAGDKLNIQSVSFAVRTYANRVSK